MASVTPRRNKSGETVWRVQFRVNGSPKERRFNDSASAEQFSNLVDRVGGAAALEVLDRRLHNIDGVPTLREWTTRYLDPESGILTGIQPGTRHGYQRIAERSFLPMLGEYPIDSISKADIGRWLMWQESQKSARTQADTIAAKTVRNYHALLSNVFKSALEHRIITANPAKSVRISEGTEREGIFLSITEFHAIMDEIPEFYQPLVMFLAGTGARWSEATAVTSGDVMWDAKPVLVHFNKAWKKRGSEPGPPVIGPTKTKAGKRWVSLWPEVVAILPRRENPDELLFQGKLSGGHLWHGSFNTRIWRPAVERSGVGKAVTIHDLRHTHVSWLIAQGVLLPSIQKRLGHEKITTTVDRYGHLMPDAQAQAADALQSMFAEFPIRAIASPMRDTIVISEPPNNLNGNRGL